MRICAHQRVVIVGTEWCDSLSLFFLRQGELGSEGMR